MNRPVHRISGLTSVLVFGILGFFLLFSLIEAPHFHYSSGDGEFEQECELCQVARAGEALVVSRAAIPVFLTISPVSRVFNESFVSHFYPKYSPRAPPL